MNDCQVFLNQKMTSMHVKFSVEIIEIHRITSGIPIHDNATTEDLSSWWTVNNNRVLTLKWK